MSEREENCIKTKDGECFVIFLVNTREKGFQNLLDLVKQQVKATDKMMIYPDWKLKVDEIETSQ
ncbi:hypothetical protein A2159_03295 [Candidatus Woesebacteria bacterium RBG_13_34_9]|uniref:Uncharacterized protein n=1 Tax=Candidatus Woesebacteria bacterium RBG_13_34_9 TaxID=1802477 RepID=A0A1F7X203_9BACT|nr:MAG: hypothetical protein A2159_03295 [Candidatus Woesebacteria bacterium RBG_13_34_9]